MSKGFVAHGGILLLPSCQFARCLLVVNLWTKRSGGLDYSKPPLVVWVCQKGCCTTAFFFLPSPGSSWLPIAKKHGMNKVLMNINDKNSMSAHVCEKLGGKLMDKIQAYNDAEGCYLMRRYWIYL